MNIIDMTPAQKQTHDRSMTLRRYRNAAAQVAPACWLKHPREHSPASGDFTVPEWVLDAMVEMADEMVTINPNIDGPVYRFCRSQLAD